MHYAHSDSSVVRWTLVEDRFDVKHENLHELEADLNQRQCCSNELCKTRQMKHLGGRTVQHRRRSIRTKEETDLLCHNVRTWRAVACQVRLSVPYDMLASV